jgi:multidrug resistance efflux pump
MWSNYVQPVTTAGQVETNTVNIVTTQAGLLTDIALNRFDEVTNGQVIGQVALFDEDQIKAEMSALESGAQLLDMKNQLVEWGKMDPAIMIKLEYLNQQTLLNVARVNFEQASNIVARDLDLMKPPGVAPITVAAYQADLAKLHALESEVNDRTKLVTQWNKDLEHIGPEATNVFARLASVVKFDVAQQQEQLRQLQKPIVLRAPISGKVTSVLHHAGERVPAGTAIISISSSRADRIVAYVRQPLNFRPKVGDVVSVRTRTMRRRTMDAQIVKIGTQLEPISPLFLPLAKMPVELGLPIALTLPQELDLLPGELVDLKISKN